jgi:FkbH-like protein
VRSAPERALLKAEWQETLFAESPPRFRLQKMKAEWPLSALRIRVHRNHAFEYVASAMLPFLGYAGWIPEFLYSDYDDAVTLDISGEADVELLWLDYDRYREKFTATELAEWLASRIATLRSETTAPILVCDWGADDARSEEFNSALRWFTASIPAVHICAQLEIASCLGEKYLDLRAVKITGTRLSDRACILTAQRLGLQWLPSVMAPRLKAVVLDLDNTLYSGVLGEDGVDGVSLTPGHIALQKHVLHLRESGIFVAVCSRNEPEDVTALFAVREDFPLKPEHLSASSVSWGAKADGIREIAAKLRIGTDAVLFIDDNPGELAAVTEEIPDTRLLFASPDGAQTERALRLYPGLWQWEASAADLVRVTDLKAAEERDSLARAARDPREYLRSLDARLTFAIDSPLLIQRLSELSNKTNQFNTAFLRLSESRVAEYCSDLQRRMVGIHLTDRLSDSGVIGGVFLTFEGDVLSIDEICISCRALGRGLENFMISQVLARTTEQHAVPRLAVRYREGARNQPARKWLSEFFGLEVTGSESISYLPLDRQGLLENLKDVPVTVEWENVNG